METREAAGAITILLIGTLPPPVGGAGVSLKQLFERLTQLEDVRVIMVNTGGVRGHRVTGLFRFIAIVGRIFRGALQADVVSLQPVPSGLPFIGPFAWLAAALFGKPFMIRMFGGEDFLDVPGLRGSIVRWLVRRTDLYLAQTKALVASAKRGGLRRVEWFPTHRPMPPESEIQDRNGACCRRFVFLSHVKPTKGIHELVAAAEKLDGNVEVDIYGPLMDGLTAEQFAGRKGVTYKGQVPPGEALRILPTYDALLFPTFWPGEGYPGIILEAYGAGLPVITTNWMAIPEIVDETSGVLVPPRDVNALADAMKRLATDAVLCDRLRRGVLAKRAFFDADRWTREFVVLCRSMMTSVKKSQGNQKAN
ncbi:MAG: glycosyltransferase family 4 protein [Planctomycetes bacterium]|nr:glycosyltransferase family 4 protein [Planctomycetota bacterium]